MRDYVPAPPTRADPAPALAIAARPVGGRGARSPLNRAGLPSVRELAERIGVAVRALFGQAFEPLRDPAALMEADAGTHAVGAGPSVSVEVQAVRGEVGRTLDDSLDVRSQAAARWPTRGGCLLYTSDAADEL